MSTALHAAAAVDLALQLLELSLPIADRAVIMDITSESLAHTGDDGRRWYDTCPMLDRREHTDEAIEQFAMALTYADLVRTLHNDDPEPARCAALRISLCTRTGDKVLARWELRRGWHDFARGAPAGLGPLLEGPLSGDVASEG